MAQSRISRSDSLLLLAITAVALFLPALLGRPLAWKSALVLIFLIIPAWLLDPLVFAGIFIIGAILCSLVGDSASPAPSWMPAPGVIWLAIAIVQLAKLEALIRHKLSSKEQKLQAQREEQQEWRAFFDNSPAGILTADGEGRIVLSNPAAQKLFGYGDRPMRGQGIAPALSALGAALRIDRKDRLFHTLTGCTGWRPNGEMFVADAWFCIAETAAGTRLAAVVVDASERLQERARGGLRSSMATSQIAMGAVLHEIRNLSAAAALMYSNLAHAETSRLPELENNADFQALGSLLKALANLAAAELRPGDGTHSSVDLAGVLGQLRIIVDPWFQESEMQVDWQVASGLPQVWGDESGLLQLFLNLVQNSNKAMSASPEKRLTIEAMVEGEWVIVRFRDTGPGVANADDLFEPFRKGTAIKGLGLFVSRAIAHSFHGELKYTPEECGSCFTVELLPLREWRKVADKYESGSIER